MFIGLRKFFVLAIRDVIYPRGTAQGLCCAMFLGLALSGCMSIAPTDGAASREQASGMRLETLHIDGTRLVTPAGNVVKLRGVNLGGWLVTESWMCGFADSRDRVVDGGAIGTTGRSTEEHLEERFGRAKTEALMNVWRANWLTRRDLDLIRDWGFNSVRVPISYRTLQAPRGDSLGRAGGKIDFSLMDWLVREAGRRGLYVIFDLHVWPDQQEQYDRIGRPEGAAILKAMAELWTQVALHYKGEGTIAAFDLINEFPGAWGVQQALAAAVRNADASRLLVIEGFSLQEFLELQRKGVFENTIYSDHIYRDTPVTSGQVSDYLQQFIAAAVPVYIGEFQPADFPGATAAMDALGLSWSTWTYKTVDMGEWGIFNYYSNLRTDIQGDSYATIMDRWSTDLTKWQRPGPPNYFMNEHRHPAARPDAQLLNMEGQDPR